MTEILDHFKRWECVTCGHEWEREAQPDQPTSARVVKDAHRNALAHDDSVAWIKVLKLKHSSQVINGGTKSKGIRWEESDHEIDWKLDGITVGLKACLVEKASKPVFAQTRSADELLFPMRCVSHRGSARGWVCLGFPRAP
jgi:protein PhnA